MQKNYKSQNIKTSTVTITSENRSLRNRSLRKWVTSEMIHFGKFVASKMRQVHEVFLFGSSLISK